MFFQNMLFQVTISSKVRFTYQAFKRYFSFMNFMLVSFQMMWLRKADATNFTKIRNLFMNRWNMRFQTFIEGYIYQFDHYGIPTSLFQSFTPKVFLEIESFSSQICIAQFFWTILENISVVWCIKIHSQKSWVYDTSFPTLQADQ